MFRIAVCDDQESELRDTLVLMNQYKNEKQLEYEVDTFLYSSELFDAIESGKKYDAYFLDVVMPKVGGIELGSLIRRKDAIVPIIYTTSSEEFALDAFSVQAMRYLIKPIQEKEFYQALDYLLHVLPKKEEKEFVMNGINGVEKIPVSQIEYIENRARRLEVVSTSGEKLVSKCIRESFEVSTKTIMETGSFVYTHKSFLVNLASIKKISTTELVMDSGKTIPISKSNSSTVKKEYLKYLALEQGGEIG